jgi:hypothetical protein
MWPKDKGSGGSLFDVVVAGVGLTGVFRRGHSRYVGHVGIFYWASRPHSYHS